MNEKTCSPKEYSNIVELHDHDTYLFSKLGYNINLLKNAHNMHVNISRNIKRSLVICNVIILYFTLEILENIRLLLCILCLIQ